MAQTPAQKRVSWRKWYAKPENRLRRIAACRARYLGTREQRVQRLARNLIDLRALKLLRGCEDCGYDENADALQFDHARGNKKYTMSSLAMILGAPTFVTELAKCDVRCANCHAIKTAQRRKGAA